MLLECALLFMRGLKFGLNVADAAGYHGHSVVKEMNASLRTPLALTLYSSPATNEIRCFANLYAIPLAQSRGTLHSGNTM